LRAKILRFATAAKAAMPLELAVAAAQQLVQVLKVGPAVEVATFGMKGNLAALRAQEAEARQPTAKVLSAVKAGAEERLCQLSFGQKTSRQEAFRSRLAELVEERLEMEKTVRRPLSAT
jgi:hypothetical protein